MAQTGFTPIQLYRTATANEVPAAGNLADGELAINTLDEKLYFKNSSGVVKEITSSAAPLASPAFTGNPTAPTAAQFDDDTSIATTAFVQRALGNTAGFTGVTANTTLTAANAGKIIYASTTGGTITLTLPGAAALKAGAKYEIYNTGVSDVVVQRSGSDTIVVNNTTNTVTAVTLSAGDSIELVNLGAGTLWYHAGGTAQLKNASGAFGASLAANGWQKLPSGLIIQWGATAFGVNAPVTFPIAFPNQTFGVVLGTAGAPSSGGYSSVTSVSLTGFSSTNNGGGNASYFAYGR